MPSSAPQPALKESLTPEQIREVYERTIELFDLVGDSARRLLDEICGILEE